MPTVKNVWKVLGIRAKIALALILFVGGIFAWGVLFNPASKTGANNAYQACTSAIVVDVPAMVPQGPGDVTYNGSDAEGAFTISGTYSLGTTVVPWVCHATKLPSGVWSAAYTLP